MPPKPPEKGIQSISSFFKPKSTPPVPPPPTNRNESSTSQILYLDSSDEEDEALKEPPNKKRKIKLEPDPNFDQSPTASPSIPSTNIVATLPLPPPAPTTQSYKRLQAFSYNRDSTTATTEKKELTKDEQKRRDLFIKKLFGGIKGKRSSYLQQDHFMSATRDDEDGQGLGIPEEEDEEEGHGGEGEEQDERMSVDDDILFEQDDEDQEVRDNGKKSKSKKDVKGKGKAIDQNGATSSSSRFSKFAAPSASKSNKTKDSSPMNSNIKYTPLEQQVIALKKANPGVLLAVEVGYKYKFFQEDAQTASKVLNIACFPQQHMLTASIPTHRLDIHTRRLLQAGHKVGIVKQLETAALKKISENKSKPFTRALVNVYTATTFVDELDVDDSGTGGGGSGGGEGTKTLMCLVEEKIGLGNEKVRIGLVAARPSTGEVIYDEFEDGLMRSELETRMLHLQPSELLLQKDLSPATESIVKHLAGQHNSNSMNSTCRIEKIPKRPNSTQAISQITEFYANEKKERKKKEMKKVPSEIVIDDSDDDDEERVSEATTGGVEGTREKVEEETEGGPSASQKTEIVETDESTTTSDFKVFDLPKLVLVSLSCLINHLASFKLSALFLHTSSFNSFSSRTTMTLNGNTIQNLELLRNNTDFKEKGSLIGVLDRCKTGMGKRLLRKWVSKPLLSCEAVNQRLEAITEIHQSSSNLALSKIRELLKSLPDLERGLSRIHFGRASPNELLRVLESLMKIGNVFDQLVVDSGRVGDEEFGLKSQLLKQTVKELPKIKGIVKGLMEQVNGKMARDGKKEDLFERVQDWPELVECKKARDSKEEEIQEELKKARKVLKKPALQFKQVALEEYLLEVKVSEKNIVPSDWLRINGTKTYYRFRSPSLQRKIQELQQARERLSAAANEAYLSFLQEVASHYSAFRTTISSLSTIDCLFSLALVALENNYVRPEIDPEEIGKVVIKQGRHPIIEQVLQEPFVPNDVEFGLKGGKRQMILTGLNMGGKSSLARMVALIPLMAQIGSFVPAESCTTSLFDGIYTRMGASDSLMTNRSTFMLELSETSEILKLATPRSLLVLDELGRGTSTNDGEAIAGAVLEWLSLERESLTVFVTHYPNLASLAKKYPHSITVNHMSCLESSSSDSTNDNDPEASSNPSISEDITFLYKLVDGLAASSHGLNVAKMAGLPLSVLKVAREKREELEKVVKARVERKKRERLESILKGLKAFDLEEGHGKEKGERLLELCKSVVSA
ncbi:hypothetical protein JCM5350_001092 [Sporobolomyces pararoseus]